MARRQSHLQVRMQVIPPELFVKLSRLPSENGWVIRLFHEEEHEKISRSAENDQDPVCLDILSKCLNGSRGEQTHLQPRCCDKKPPAIGPTKSISISDWFHGWEGGLSHPLEQEMVCQRLYTMQQLAHALETRRL